jgi:tetratricopeptide (TPR) repeat protein
MNTELFEYLLSQPESDILDFKSEFYDFSGDTEKAKEAKESKFIKDIISFANTKRDKSSYIIIGIKENGTTKEKELLGVTTHPDDASLQEKIKDKVYPVPEFLYYPHTYKNQQFGIIEILIPKYSEEPYYPKKDYLGGLLKSELYFRRGSSNSEATPEEERHIREWFKSLKNKPANSDKPQKTTIELTNIPDIILEDVIGRDKELSDIFGFFQKNERPLVVTAIGGIGKSTLARAYVKKFRSQYQNIIWIDVTGSFQSSIVSNHTLLHNLKIELPKLDFDLSDISKGIMGINRSNSLMGEEKKSNYDIVLNALRNVQGKNLFILDNAESNLSYEKIQLPTYPHWHVLATSREKIEGFSEYPLKYLSKENTVQLFRKYAGDKGSDFEIEKLLELINFHTLIIELLAKILKESLEIDSVEELYTLLTSHRLDDESLQYKIQTDHSKQEIELYPYLLKLFDLSKLEADNFSIPVLKQICLFPPDFLPVSIFIELLESEEISKKDITHTLKYLSKKGWLEENNKDFKIHKIIKGFLLWYILKPIFEDSKALVDRLGKKLILDIEIEVLKDYADIALSMSEYFKEYEMVNIINGSSFVHYHLQKYSDVIKLQSLVLGFTHYPKEKKWASYSTRAYSYEALLQYDKAIEDYTEVIKLNPENGDVYIFRASCYFKIHEYEKAIADCTKLISLNSKNAESYINRGLIYKNLMEYEKAISDFNEAIRLNPNDVIATVSKQIVTRKMNRELGIDR